MSYIVNKAPGSPSYTNKADGSRTYGIKYIVESTTINDVNIHAARKAIGMPVVGDAYVNDPGAFAQEAVLDDIKQAADKTIFTFSVDYQPREGGGGANETQSEDPTKQPPKIGYGNVKYQIPFIRGYKAGDVQGTPTQPVLNLCKQKYDPPAVAMKINSLMTIQYNVRLFRYEWIDQYIDTINRSPVVVCGVSMPQYKAKINDLSASNSFDSNGKEFWQVSITIESSTTKFLTSLLEQAYECYNAAGNLDHIYIWAKLLSARTACKSDLTAAEREEDDKYITPVSEPKLLTSAGKLAANGATPIYTDYQQCYDMDWSPLLIPKTKGGTIRI